MATKKETTKKKGISNKAKANWCTVGEWASRLLVPVVPLDTKFHDKALEFRAKAEQDKRYMEVCKATGQTVEAKAEEAGIEEVEIRPLKEEPKNEGE